MSKLSKLDLLLESVPTPDEKLAQLETGWDHEATQLLLSVTRALNKSKTAGVTFSLKGNRTPWSNEAVNHVILALGVKGWDVKRNRGSEPRDPQGWDDLVVKKP
jgi:hypothetical protein